MLGFQPLSSAPLSALLDFGTSSTANGVTVTTAYSFISGAPSATALISGATLTENYSVIQGAASADSSVSGYLFTANLSLVSGYPVVDITVNGQTLTEAFSIIAGQPQADADVSGETLTYADSLIAGYATASATVNGFTIANPYELFSGTARGTGIATAQGRLRAAIAKATKSTFAVTAPQQVNAIYRRQTTVYNPINGSVVVTNSDTNVKVVFTRFENLEIDKVTVQVGDVKMLIQTADLSIVPDSTSDVVIYSGKQYNVLKYKVDPSNAVYVIQLRSPGYTDDAVGGLNTKLGMAVSKAVSAAFTAIADIKEFATYRRSVSTYDPSLGTNSVVDTDYPLTVVFTRFEETEVDHNVVLTDDIKMIVQTADMSVVPNTGTDRVVRGGEVYEIINFKVDPSKSVYFVQLRSA